MTKGSGQRPGPARNPNPTPAQKRSQDRNSKRTDKSAGEGEGKPTSIFSGDWPEVVSPPNWLSQEATVIFNELLPMVRDAGLIDPLHIRTFAKWCELEVLAEMSLADIKALAGKRKKNGRSAVAQSFLIEMDKKGNSKSNPAVRGCLQILSATDVYGRQFGLDPISYIKNKVGATAATAEGERAAADILKYFERGAPGD